MPRSLSRGGRSSHERAAPRVHAVRRGLATTRWPGRLDQYPAQRRTLLDGARNNPEAAGSLRDYLRQEGSRHVYLVFGAMSDKDFYQMGKLLFPVARSIHLARIANSRSAEPRRYRRGARTVGSHPLPCYCPLRSPGGLGGMPTGWARCRHRLALSSLGELLPVVKASVNRRKKRSLQGPQFTRGSAESPGTDHLPLLNRNFFDHSALRSPDFVLHLHGFQHYQTLVIHDRISHLAQEGADYLSRHSADGTGVRKPPFPRDPPRRARRWRLGAPEHPCPGC